MRLRLLLLLSAALFSTACSLPVETFRVTAYSEIARVQMASGDPAGARETARLALAAMRDTQSEDERLFGVPSAAIAQIRAGDVRGAFSTVEGISDGHARVTAYTALALGLRDSGYPQEAQKAASQALATVLGLENENKKAELTVFAAWVQAMTGDIAGALENAETLTQSEQRDGLFGLIAVAQVDAGDIAGALDTAALIDETGKQNDTWMFSLFFRGIAVDSFAVFGDLLFESRMPVKAVVMKRVAMAQMQAGDAGGARQSFLAAMQLSERPHSVNDQVRSMGNVALARARVGDFSGAIESLNHAERLADPHRLEDGSDVEDARGYVLMMHAAISGRSTPDDLMQRLGDAGGRIETLVAAALARMQLGKTQHAEALLDAATAGAERDDDLSLAVAAYGNLAVIRAEQGDRAGGRAAARRALEIAESIPETSEDRVIGLFFASVGLARAGEVDLALQTAARIDKPKKPQ